MSTNITHQRRAWSVTELAAAYGFSVGFVRKQIRIGALPAKKIGERVIVLDDEWKAYLSRASLTAVKSA